MNFRKNNTPGALVSGISINKATYIDQNGYNDDEKGNTISLLILLLFGCYGFVGALLTDFGIYKHNLIIYLLVLILCLVFSIIFYYESYIKYTMPAVMLLFFVFVVMCYRWILIGFHKTLSQVIHYLNEEYHKNFTIPLDLSRRPYDFEMILFLMTAAFLICLILAVWVIYRPRASMLFLLYCPLLFVEAITSISPNPLFLGMILLCVLGTAIRGRVRTAFQKTASLPFLPGHTQTNYLEENEYYLQGMQLRVLLYQVPVLLIAVIIIFVISMFPANAFFQANQSEMKAAVEASLIGGTVKSWTTSQYNPLAFLFTDKGIGGIGDGTLGRVGTVRYSGQNALVVNTSSAPMHSIYLKAFTGDIYGNNRWLPSSIEKEYYENYSPFQISPLTDHNNYYNAIMTTYHTDPIDISVHNIGANKAYSYLPYFSFAKETEAGLEAIDFIDVPDDYDSFGRIQNNIRSDASAYDNNSYFYSIYVPPEYLLLPESGLERLQAECARTGYYGWDDITDINQFIIETLHTNTKYSLNPGALPRGEEFTEYFLYEQQKGYCTHYATAATLMYRMFGIPSRYVMGYRVPAYLFLNNSFLNESSATAFVKDERAHAWTEIYLEGMGWVPIEVTPADMDNFDYDTAVDESNTAQDANAQAQARTQREFNDNIFTAIAVLMLVFLIAFLGFFIHRMSNTYRKRFRKPDPSLPNDSIRRVYINLYRIFIFAGLSKTADLSDAELFDFVQVQFTAIGRQQFDRFMDLVLQANYSNHKLSADDLNEAVSIYKSCRLHISNQLPWYKKLRFRIVCPAPR